MKAVLLDILFGFLVNIVITIFEFIVTLPFGEPGEVSSKELSSFINRELLLTALPAALTTFTFTWLRKTKSMSDSLRRAIIWAVMLALSYVLIGIGNGNFSEIFTTVGIYALLACTFVGPLIYAKIRHIK